MKRRWLGVVTLLCAGCPDAVPEDRTIWQCSCVATVRDGAGEVHEEDQPAVIVCALAVYYGNDAQSDADGRAADLCDGDHERSCRCACSPSPTDCSSN